ncbi:MAG: ATP-binding cassette domain-containing protein, partial [Chlamydiota bacterium]
SIIIIGIILTFGAFILTNQKELILPILLTFLGLSHRMATRVQLLFRSIGTIATHYGNIFRFNQILKEKDDYQNETVGHPLKKLASSIEFQSVELVYPKNNSSALINFSYSLEKGKTIALVGPSGAGKSTIVDLLVGLYSPTKGRIFIDGNDLSSIDTKSWRNLIGVVSQDIFLFHDTIEENIKFGLHNISHQQIETAAKEAGAHDFITKLPQGYKTILGERGYRLSGGEKQRIALARTLIKDPKILILDEATSNLDSHSEKLIQETIEKNQHKRTILIVAHRLSTIIHSDDILVIKNGKLVEQGSHETLIQENGFYSYLWKLQSSKNESILTNIMPN